MSRTQSQSSDAPQGPESMLNLTDPLIKYVASVTENDAFAFDVTNRHAISMYSNPEERSIDAQMSATYIPFGKYTSI